MRAAAEFVDVTPQRFRDEIVAAGRPAVLRGLVAEWPAVEAARRSTDDFASYLRSTANEEAGELWAGSPEIAGRFDFTPDLTGFNHERKLATIGQLLDLLLRQRGASEPWSLFAGALPLDRHAPAFRAGNAMPLVDDASKPLVSLWLGNQTRTAVHWDLPQNLACVVAGRRRFTLFPTDQVANLYVGPLDFTLAGQPSSLVDIENPDLERFPRFREALAQAETTELEPGDALYLPSLWWHGVRSLDELGAMVNYWWRDGDGWTGSPLNALLHAVMMVRPLPARDRDAWRAFFDHYVFDANGDPAAHIPPEARGILGDDTGELFDRLRESLARALKPARG